VEGFPFKQEKSKVKTVIHVNQHIIKHNRKTESNDPALTVKTYKSNNYAHEVDILGPSKIVYRPQKPLPCGAHCWIETESQVISWEAKENGNRTGSVIGGTK